MEHGEVQFGMQEYEDGDGVQEMVAGWRKGLVDRLEAAERPPMQHCTMRLSHVKYRFQGTFYCPKSSKKCVCTLSTFYSQ